jgi:hypothetical protein
MIKVATPACRREYMETTVAVFNKVGAFFYLANCILFVAIACPIIAH